METKSPLLLCFPPSYRISEKWELLQKQNPTLRLEYSKKDELLIFEKDIFFEYIESVELFFPKEIMPTYRQKQSIEHRSKSYRIESDAEKITIIMATSSLIGMLTFAVLGSIYIWLKNTKQGRGYAETTPYIFTEKGEKIRREADASYISYEDYDEKTQDNFGLGKAIPVPPTLVVEIVSAKYGTKAALWKMQNIWIRFGSKIGLVICPFTEKIYVFEKDHHYSQSIYLPFMHPKLEGYIGDFSEEVRKIRKNLE